MKKVKWDILGCVSLIILAVLFLFAECSSSSQAVMADVMKVTFQGEYKIADGPWKQIRKEENISAMEGDVTLRGYFQTETPDEKVIGRVSQGSQVALFFDHIGAELFINGESSHVFDAENPQAGAGACGEIWIVYEYTGTETDTVEIVLKNPHKFGNYNAVNQFLSSMYMYADTNFENKMLDESELQRNIGFAIIVVSLIVIGVAIFSFLLQLVQSKIIAATGLALFFGGGYFVLHAPNMSVWNDSVVFNTCGVQLCMMFYIFFVMCIVEMCLVDKPKKAGKIAVGASGAVIGILIIASSISGRLFYDEIPYWIMTVALAGAVLTGCCIYSFRKAGKGRKLCLSFCVLTLLAMYVDIFGTAYGWWQGGRVSQGVFVILFLLALVIVLKVIPANIHAAIKEKELKEELQQNRIAMMLSQIQPHFLYNSITAIQGLCRQNPEEARTALGDFADYLRGNMDSLNSESLIPFSIELSHIEAYLKLEKLRFGEELNVVYDIQEKEFSLPSLTVQPLVENAVKHGILTKENGGTIALKTCREGDMICISVVDDGSGFDTEAVSDQNDQKTHIGLQNVRKRLQQMVNGTLVIASTPGKGTIAVIMFQIGEK